MSKGATLEKTNKKHEELRERLLETSMNILREDGREGLSLRRIADLSDTSTQMIYTIFGDKDALVEAIYQEGSERVVEQFRSVPTDLDPLERLYELGQEYRNYALENRALYEAMFSSRISEKQIVKKTEVFDLFRDAVEDCCDSGLLTLGDPDVITETFWAAAHGAIGLDLSGYYDSDEEASDAYDEVIRAVFDGFRVEDPTSMKSK